MRTVCIVVPAVFEGDDLVSMHDAAQTDSRLADALRRAPGGRITQYLAGAPKLLERHETAPPEVKALIDVAIDARRLGHQAAFPGLLLVEAARGYLDDTWDQFGYDIYRQAADAGDPFALIDLSRMRKEVGDRDGAERCC